MSFLEPSSRIFVAGHRGLVGSAVVRALKNSGFRNVLTRTRQELDLLDGTAVDAFYEQTRPEVVLVAAAKVGGIQANNVYRADFIRENLQIQTNLIWGAHKAGVRRLVFLGSSCIYPRLAPQPMPETCLLSGPLEPTNRPYAVAKIAGLELVNSLRLQYGREYFSVMPTNLYGPNDNFDLENSHVLPALIRRFIEAKAEGRPEVVVWGTGAPKREFLFADDCAEAIVFLTAKLTGEVLSQSPQGKQGFFHVNVGSGTDISIADLARTIAEKVGYQGRITFDATRPDGTPRKLLDVSFLLGMGWRPEYDLGAGLAETITWYRHNQR